MFKVVALVASCPAASLIVPMLPLGVSLFWCNLGFCLFQRKLVFIYLWGFSIKLTWTGESVFQKDDIEKYGVIPWLLEKSSQH